MGYVHVLAPCYACHRPFTFHPTRVPSIVVNGSREPVCAACVARVNPRRIANGLPPIVPLPGAYDEADEADVMWGDE